MNESNAFLDDMDRKVREFGWGVVYVGDDCECMQCRAEGVTPQPSFLPPFAYTVGLTREYGHPEIVITGAPMGCAKTLNEFGQRVRNGVVFCGGQRFSYTQLGLVCELIEVDWQKSHRNLPVAWQINGGATDALQLVWPDAANRLPWEHGYSLARRQQPLWGRPPAASRRGTAPAPRLRQRRLPPGPGRAG
jgi:hypothetical protein